MVPQSKRAVRREVQHLLRCHRAGIPVMRGLLIAELLDRLTAAEQTIERLRASVPRMGTT